MELKEFIKEAIVQIVQGVEEAREALKDIDVLINPSLTTNGYVDNEGTVTFSGGRGNGKRQAQNIEINVAVTIENKTGTKSGISVITGFFGAGLSGSNEELAKAISTLKFSIPISLPFERDMIKQIKKE